MSTDTIRIKCFTELLFDGSSDARPFVQLEIRESAVRGCHVLLMREGPLGALKRTGTEGNCEVREITSGSRSACTREQDAMIRGLREQGLRAVDVALPSASPMDGLAMSSRREFAQASARMRNAAPLLRMNAALKDWGEQALFG